MKRPGKAVTPVLSLASVAHIRKPSRAGDKVYKDIVDQLRQMLRQAECGELIGFGFIAMFSDEYSTMDSYGEVEKNPLFAAGLLASYSYQIMEKMNRELNNK